MKAVILLAYLVHLSMARARVGSGSGSEPSVAWPNTVKATGEEGSGTDIGRRLYQKTVSDDQASGSHQRDSLLRTGWQPPKVWRVSNRQLSAQSSASRASGHDYEVRAVNPIRSARVSTEWKPPGGFAEPSIASAEDSYVFHITSLSGASSGSGAKRKLAPVNARIPRVQSALEPVTDFGRDSNEKQIYVVRTAPSQPTAQTDSTGWQPELSHVPFEESTKQVYLVKTTVLDSDFVGHGRGYSYRSFDTPSYHASFIPAQTSAGQSYVIKSVDPSALSSGYKSTIRNAVSSALRLAGNIAAPVLSSKKVYLVKSSGPSTLSGNGWPDYGVDSEPLETSYW